MIYFKKNDLDYIFVHIPKTAGTSIQNTLIEKSDFSENIKTSGFKSISIDMNNCDGHVPAWFVAPKLKINNVKFLAVIRNPWARMFSLFQHTLLRKNKEKNNTLESNLFLDTRYHLSNYFLEKSHEFINNIGTKNIKEIFEFWLFFIGRHKKIIPQNNANFNLLSQNWWLLKDTTKNYTQEIFQYEAMDRLEKYLNIDIINFKQKSIFRSNDRYRDFYTKESKEFVANLDSWVIKKYNYKFD